jgi:hypothetical protein
LSSTQNNMTATITATTQDHLDIEDIKNDLVILKNGRVCAVLTARAVNFDLLSELEQDAIISSFSNILNSLTFPIQVVVRSKRLDITKYVEKVKRIEDRLTDPLLKHQAESYRRFVQDFIKNNMVLDKKFYIVVPTGDKYSTEFSTDPLAWLKKLSGTHNKRISVNITQVMENAKIQLMPKVDHVIGQFNGINVKCRMMTTQELVELYFDIYNPSSIHGQRIRTSVEDYKTAIVNPAILEE